MLCRLLHELLCRLLLGLLNIRPLGSLRERT